MIVKDAEKYIKEKEEKYSDEKISAIQEELNPCGCGCDEVLLYLDWVDVLAENPMAELYPRSYDVGYVAKCHACGMRTRMVDDPNLAIKIWNNAFRNNSTLLGEIEDLKKRIAKLEGGNGGG